MTYRKGINQGGAFMRRENVSADITIIGGGLAGTCAAIAAARLGRKVALVQNRGVLGGNSSSEVRVWVAGATKHGVNRYARETGIMGELFVENQYRNPDGNPYLWDALLMEKVRDEANISLFLNTEVTAVKMDEQKGIESVEGFMSGSERVITFESTFFIDATGDGLVGFLAGAEFSIGREGFEKYHESLAPKSGDNETLGSTLFFYTKDVGHPVKYIKPNFAKDITKTAIMNNRIIKKEDNGCAYWWIEWGGEFDIVHDNEKVRDELQAVVYGIWDYIKNSGEYDADNLTLDWIGSVPGKREYRRFMGEYVLKQQDIEEQTLFEDRIGFGGWSIDLHPATGMYNDSVGAQHSVADGVYHIPYRILYAKEISNLFFAGRDVSASHVAFGTIRVMATCAVMGQAAGTAAAFAVGKGISPTDIYHEQLNGYQQLLLREDASVLGVKNEDQADLARSAAITASHTLKKINTFVPGAKLYQLEKAVAFSLPVDPEIKRVDLMVTTTRKTKLTIKWYATGKPQNYIPAELIGEQTVSLAEHFTGWQPFEINWQPEHAQNLFVIVNPNADCSVYLGDSAFAGVLSYLDNPIGELSQPELHDYTRKSPLLYWTNQKINRKNFVFRTQTTNAYDDNKVLNGLVRPYGGPNMWVAPVNGAPEYLDLSWDGPITIKQINLTFNDDVNEDIINLHHHRTAFEVVPELIKDYQIQYEKDGQWIELLRASDNRVRHVVHQLKMPIKTSRLRLNLLQTNGSHQFSMNEIRVY